jgi:hypothetical protein
VSVTTATSTTTTVEPDSTTTLVEPVATTIPPDVAAESTRETEPPPHRPAGGPTPPDLGPDLGSSTHLGIAINAWTTLGASNGELFAHVSVTAPSGALRAIHITYGDGTFDPLDGHVECTGVMTPFAYVTSFRHVYALPGSYDVEASVTVASDCPFPDGEVDHWSSTTVGADVPTGYGRNGPALPTFQVNRAAPSENPTRLEIFPVAWDDDGWVHHLTLDWGDGSPPITLANTSACQYVFDSFAQGIWATPGVQQHEYANAGQYVVTVTATSTDCDGNGAQTASTLEPFTAG